MDYRRSASGIRDRDRNRPLGADDGHAAADRLFARFRRLGGRIHVCGRAQRNLADHFFSRRVDDVERATLGRDLRPAGEVLGAIEGRGFHGIERHPEARTVPGLCLFRFNAPLVFFNAPYFRQEARRAVAAAGRDSECRALAAAVRFHTEHRVFLNGGRTVVFR